MTGLLLSAGDLRRLRCCTRALLSPLEHEHEAGWAAAISTAARELFGAERAEFRLPAPDIRPPPDRDCGADPLRHFRAPDMALDLGNPRWAVDPAAGHRDTHFRESLDTQDWSIHHDGHIVRTPGFDMLCAASRLSAGGHPAALHLHYGPRQDPHAAERSLFLLELIHPALEAGVRTFQRLWGWRESLCGLLDRAEVAMVLYDMSGHPLQRNQAWGALSLREGEARNIATGVRELAATLAALHSSRAQPPGGDSAMLARMVHGRSRQFRLVGSVLARGWEDPQPCVLVTVRETTLARDRERADRPLGLPGLARRYQMTMREAEVAVLLVRRLTNREIARLLDISEHTARHHTERVLGKLGVHSRRHVGKILYPSRGYAHRKRGKPG